MPEGVKCEACNNLSKNGWCEKVIDAPYPDLERDCQYFKQKTNADRIRAMTDEELAQILAILTKNDVCLNPSKETCDSCPFSSFCGDCIEGNELEWLQSPCGGADHE